MVQPYVLLISLWLMLVVAVEDLADLRRRLERDPPHGPGGLSAPSSAGYGHAGWTLAIGQVISYAAGLPVIVVTAFLLLVYLTRSGIRWDLASALLVTGAFGRSAGVIPAIIDAIIAVNKVIHNTLWVPLLSAAGRDGDGLRFHGLADAIDGA